MPDAPAGPDPSYPARPGDTSVELASGLERRWSPRRLDAERPVADGDLRAVLEAARWSASTYNEQPWRFLVARRGDPWRDAVEAALNDGNAWARRASILVVGVARTTFSRNDRPNRHAWHDVGLALGSMMAEAMARGLVTHPMAGFSAERVRADFGVPDGFEPVWVLALGQWDPELADETLRERDERPRSRKPLEELVFGARFGEPHPL